MIVHAIHSIRRPRSLWTVIGGREVVPVPRHLLNRLGQRAVEGGARPLGQAAQALGELGFRHCVIDGPGAIQDLAAQCSPAALGEFEDGVQEAEHQSELRERAGATRPAWPGNPSVHTERDVIVGKDRGGFGLKLAVGVPASSRCGSARPH